MAKTVDYCGKQYNVPDWVKFIATDSDGAIFGYEEKPAISEFWKEHISKKGRVCRLTRPEEWRDTLQEID